MAWKEFLAENYFTNPQECMDRCYGLRDKTEIMLEMALNTKRPTTLVIQLSALTKFIRVHARPGINYVYMFVFVLMRNDKKNLQTM